jgi:hypothetical protein
MSGQINGRNVYYTAPVGIDDTLREALLELAREAGTPLYDAKNGSSWDGFPAAGWDYFAQAVEHVGMMKFGQLCITPSEVRAWGDDKADEAIDVPGSLRARLRENPFRSLATSSDLPNVWHVRVTSMNQLCAVVETVYPGAIADWAANRRGRMQTNTFDVTIGRQTGNYRELNLLSDVQKTEIVRNVCGGCVRYPTWFGGQTPPDYLPCPEACNHWLSHALEKLKS